MLKELLKSINLEEMLLTKEDFKPFPTYYDRDAWDNLDEDLKVFCLKNGEGYLEYDWPPLKATLYMEFLRNGNRSRYEDIYFARRTALTSLMLAECIEGKGRFIDDIINGVWAICEESSWVIPAHNNHMLDSWENALPDIEPEYIFIDLFSAATGSLMTWVCYFLQLLLDKQSPLICKRIKYELSKRIIEPFIRCDIMEWMGSHERKVNNWNPWILSNILPVVLLIEEDREKRINLVKKCILTLDNFIDGYEPDGGCDEGPNYWNVAGGSMFDCLELLFEATEGKFEVYQNELIKNIGKYIYRAHIDGKYYVNFGDGFTKAVVSSPLVYRVGNNIGEENMADFAAAIFEPDAENNPNSLVFFRTLKNFMVFKKLKEVKKTPPLVRDVWLDGLQFMAGREKQGCSKGLYIGAKGGHNNQSHNHNDIGNYVVFFNGNPVLIDAGVETYTAKTFSPERYEIWTMQSSYHNLPEINGCMQMPGEDYKATDVHYELCDEVVKFSLNIGTAYPKEAGINRWERSFEFNRSLSPYIEIKDSFQLTEPTENIVLNLITSQEHCIKPGSIVFYCKDGSKVLLNYSENMLEAETEEIKLYDDLMLKQWQQEKLYRIKFKTYNKLSCGEFSFRISS